MQLRNTKRSLYSLVGIHGLVDLYEQLQRDHMAHSLLGNIKAKKLPIVDKYDTKHPASPSKASHMLYFSIGESLFLNNVKNSPLLR